MPPAAGSSGRKLEIAADALRLPPWEAIIAQLSGGEKRRVALCRLLLSQPDMLLLDEPTNHLDAESVAWLERYLEEYPSTVVAVTHDRYFLDNVAKWILELDRGHGIPWQGNYSSWLEQKEQRLALEEREREALRKTLARELEWVRANPKARQAKSKARLARYDELASREFQERNETNEIYIPPGPRLGDLVIEVKGLRKGFGDRLLIDNLNFKPAARRHRRHHRSEWRRQNHAVSHAHRRRAAGRRRDPHRPDGEACLRRSVAPDARRQENRLGRRSPAASTSSRSTTTRRRRAATSAASISRARSSSS